MSSPLYEYSDIKKCFLVNLDGVGCRHLLPGGILQKYLRDVPLVSHVNKRAAAACPLKTTFSTTYVALLHLTLLHSLQIKI